MLKIDFISFFQGFNCKCPRGIVFSLVVLFFPRCDIYNNFNFPNFLTYPITYFHSLYTSAEFSIYIILPVVSSQLLFLSKVNHSSDIFFNQPVGVLRSPEVKFQRLDGNVELHNLLQWSAERVVLSTYVQHMLDAVFH